MSDIKNLTQKICQFRDERDWKQFHNPKDMALSLVLEATELLEIFQWKNGEDINIHLEKNREAFEDELADILYWILLIADGCNVDIIGAAERKLKKNIDKYPIPLARGKSTKYTEL